MEGNFSMEWKMEWKIFVWNGNETEKYCQYGIWKNRLPFHAIPCPDHQSTGFEFKVNKRL